MSSENRELDELSKATRSMRISIFNNTEFILKREKIYLFSGVWRVQPHETIHPYSAVEFGSEGTLMTGTEAGVLYKIKSVFGNFEFMWDNPLLGKRGFKRTAPEGFEIDVSTIDGNNCVVSFVLSETEARGKNIEEVAAEIKKLDDKIAENQKVVKSVQKLTSMYVSNKDSTGAKSVDNELQARFEESHALKEKHECFSAQLEVLRNRENAEYLESELKLVKERIESIVKSKKALEHMRDVYTNEKDLKSATSTEQQVNQRAREETALRRRELKLIEKIVDIRSVKGKMIKARALFDYEKGTDSEISLKPGDIITVIDMSNDEWMEGELDGNHGYFPKAYVEIIEEEKQSTNDSDAVSENVPTNNSARPKNLYPKATVISEYEGREETELALRVGEIVIVYSWEDQYWWEGEIAEGEREGITGYFPSYCVNWLVSEDTQPTEDSVEGEVLASESAPIEETVEEGENVVTLNVPDSTGWIEKTQEVAYEDVSHNVLVPITPPVVTTEDRPKPNRLSAIKEKEKEKEKEREIEKEKNSNVVTTPFLTPNSTLTNTIVKSAFKKPVVATTTPIPTQSHNVSSNTSSASNSPLSSALEEFSNLLKIKLNEVTLSIESLAGQTMNTVIDSVQKNLEQTISFKDERIAELELHTRSLKDEIATLKTQLSTANSQKKIPPEKEDSNVALQKVKTQADTYKDLYEKTVTERDHAKERITKLESEVQNWRSKFNELQKELEKERELESQREKEREKERQQEREREKEREREREIEREKILDGNVSYKKELEKSKEAEKPYPTRPVQPGQPITPSPNKPKEVVDYKNKRSFFEQQALKPAFFKKPS